MSAAAAADEERVRWVSGGEKLARLRVSPFGGQSVFFSLLLARRESRRTLRCAASAKDAKREEEEELGEGDIMYSGESRDSSWHRLSSENRASTGR